MKKISKERVDYRAATTKKHCGNCDMFHPRLRECDLVAGRIDQSHVCDRWEAKK